MSKLNRDIFFLLFKELQGDSKSLFSCLLVNRLWCETVVPILWRNPWRYHYGKRSSLYYIITSYLPDNIKDFLTRQGIQLPPVPTQPLLFDYLSFCRSIDITAINNIIGYETSAYNRFLLQSEFYHLFMRKCQELKYLDMRSVEHQIFYLPGARARLDSLCELICETSIDPTYFYGLTYVCNNIEKLIIENTCLKVNDGIIKLIEIQRNLKYFEWKQGDDDDVFETYEDIYEETFLALAKKAQTLTHFITSFEESCEYTFPPEVLPKLHNLQALKLSFMFDYEYDRQLINSVYPDLEFLQIDDYAVIDTVTSIIKNSGGHMRKLIINKYDVYEPSFDKQSLILIRTIYEKCPLIECLSIAFPSSKQHFIEFEKLLKTCQNLRVLLIDMKCKNGTNSKEFLKVLNQSPINLREIRFFDNLNFSLFSLETLKRFLENWRGRPALSMLTDSYDYNNEEYVKIINRYKNDGVLKDFRCVDNIDMNFES